MADVPRALLFGGAGVAFRYDPQARLAALARRARLTTDEVHRRLFASGFAHGCAVDRPGPARWHLEAGALLACRIGSHELARLWVLAYRIDPALEELVTALPAGLATALVCNDPAPVRDALAGQPAALLDRLRPQVLSADVGRAKPDPAPWRMALRLLDLPPQRALAIEADDADVAAAQLLGMDAIRYRDPPTLAVELAARGIAVPA